ncbi:MAG: glycoside hydrolase family 3 C-terminal domain-containing protein [Clostridia bacterium]|nr:glycoside hydrolase family 3 C-terminal domain-containing protein [Clostridia bacterium]
MEKQIKKKSNLLFCVVCVICAAVFSAITIVGNVLAFGVYAGVLESYFGIEGASVENYETAQYFERHAPTPEAVDKGVMNLGRTIEAEGAVLLKNDNNALPLSEGSCVSIFSQSSVDMIYSASGSGSIGSAGATLREALQGENITANPTLWNFYMRSGYSRTTGGLAGGVVSYYDARPFLNNEVPYSKYTPEVIESYASYDDAAIIVISRTGAENGDLPRNMSKATKGEFSGSILELDNVEREMVKNVCENFEKVIVLLNTSNPMECGFLDEFGIDSCLWIGGLGTYGMSSVARILVGNVNPSGRLVDTYAYDAFSAPATQNVGNFEYWTNNGTKETEHHYFVYAEGIYVGYKYYETRYEDAMLNRANVGEYNYDQVVQYPFGYGISYTEFEWSDFSAKMKKDKIEVSVEVKNVGSVRGKEVVQVYYQSPYTDYDKANGIEKAAVNLAGFEKTKILQPGESCEVKVTFNVEDMKSYDANGEKTYLLEESTNADRYYVTAAKNAHEATQNILNSKGVDSVGNSDFVENDFDISKKLYNVDTVSGNEVTNRFDNTDGLQYHSDIKYLSRQNWTAMDNNGLRYGTPTDEIMDVEGEEFKAILSDELKRKLELEGFAAAEAPEETFTMPVYGKKGDAKLIEMKGRDADDPAWEALLDQMTLEEMTRIVCLSGYKIYAAESISMPHSTDCDGPHGWKTFIGDGIQSAGFPFEIVLASTWNKEVYEQMGYIMGELCLWTKISAATSPNLTGWYAPAMNIHRTPFGGRNNEYYSECPTLSAIAGSLVTKAASERGVRAYIKHFALNDQDRNRMTDPATWVQEQAIREIYLKPFEAAIKDGKSLGVMSSYNRVGAVWAGGSYALITEVLRNEWGFDGIVLSDYMDGDYENVDQMLAAGADAALNTASYNSHATVTCTTTGAQAITYMRRAMKHVLYSVANSNAMNGIDGATIITGGTPIYHRYMLIVNIALAIIIALFIILIPLRLFVFNPKNKQKK